MKKALIVDDISSIRFEIAKLLEKKGFEVIEASNGQEAIDLYKKENPFLVTMDINMPKLDGLRATQLITAYDPNAKIMICSSMVSFNNYIEIGRKAGAKVFISKPFTESNFLEKIDDLIK